MRKMLFPACLRALVFTFVLVALASCLVGCNRGTPAETAAEVHRRHVDVMRTNASEMQDDLDAVFMLDKPSKLSDRHVR